MIFKGLLSSLLLLLVLSCANNTDYDVNKATSTVNTSKIDTIQTHQFIARLYEGFNSSANCGVIATAYAYKFRVIQTDLKDLKDKSIVIIQPCPELLGNGFFKTGEIYKILIGEKNMDYIISNSYQKEDLHTFWSKEISLVK